MIAVVLKGWPRLSETFIARELQALEARGLALSLWSLRHPTDRKTHPAHAAVTAPVAYLPEYLHQEPGRVFRAWRKLRWAKTYRAAKALFRADWTRDRTRNRLRRFGQALVLAAELPPDTKALYAHFIHTPGSVAPYAAALTGLLRRLGPCPRHLDDAGLGPRRQASGRALRHHLHRRRPCPPRRPQRQRPPAPQPPWPRSRPLAARAAAPAARRPRDPADPVTILSVGRAVEKGAETLLDALARLDPALHWRFGHIGGGLERRPESPRRTLGIGAQVTFMGSQSEDAVRSAMRDADLFALAPIVAADGDRDGLPNVLVEAQSQSLAVVSTRVGGIDELITDGANGVLCPPADPAAFAAALARLIADPAAAPRWAKPVAPASPPIFPLRPAPMPSPPCCAA